MAKKETDKASKNKEAKRANKLADETSTYLLQHAHNPVDWYPWGPEALARSKAEDKPILLSIGYSACHWCHVMEHESFEDDATAAMMNSDFVNIKVDREERPDIDEIYMKTVQLLTGHGSWPMTVFLTPELKPFYAGTYFPPQDRHGMPSFQRVLLGVKTAWDGQRDDILESSNDITKHLNMLDKTKAADTDLNEQLLDAAIDPLLRVFDKTWGGFGSAPKFPHSASISFGFRRMKPGSTDKNVNRDDCLEMVRTTLDRMAWGGIHDQLAGGFARYSVDRRWLIPHFEKMLYDNALIPRNYLEGYLVTGNAYWLEVAKECLNFVLRELTLAEGGFYCSLDADSEGVEGKYYVWTPEQITEVLGKEDAAFFCDIFDVSVRGNFEHGNSALNFPNGPEDCMARYKLSSDEFWARVNPLRARLLEAREKRIRPGRDDKMLTSWTSLMISAMVDGYKVAGDSKYLDAATKAANFILDHLMKDGRLLRTYGRGIAKLNAYLEDYAYLIQALLDLASCDANSRWLSTAVSLNEKVISHFWDAENVGFFFTSDDHEELIARTKHYYDGSTPSSSSVSVMNLIRLSRLCSKPELLDKAAATMKSYTAYFHKAPDQFSNLLCALDTYLSEPIEVALVYDSSCAPHAKELLVEFNSHYIPNAVIVVADLSSPDIGKLIEFCPLLKNRPVQNGKATFYICKNFSCEKPITDREELKASLAELIESSVWKRIQRKSGE